MKYSYSLGISKTLPTSGRGFGPGGRGRWAWGERGLARPRRRSKSTPMRRKGEMGDRRIAMNRVAVRVGEKEREPVGANIGRVRGMGGQESVEASDMSSWLT